MQRQRPLCDFAVAAAAPSHLGQLKTLTRDRHPPFGISSLGYIEYLQVFYLNVDGFGRIRYAFSSLLGLLVVSGSLGELSG